MGILSMFGLVTSKQCARLLKEKSDRCAELVTRIGEEVQTSTRLALDLAEANKIVSALTDKNVELISKLQTARAEVDALTPDAEAHRARLEKAADYDKNRRVRPSRAKKVAG